MLTFYTDVARVERPSISMGTSLPGTSSLTLNESPDITNIKALISNTSTELDSVNEKLAEDIMDVEKSPDNLRSLVHLQKKLQKRLSDLNDIKLYQWELDQLIQNQSHCEGLCDIEKKELEKEIALFIQYVNIDLLSKYSSSTDVENMFHAMATRVQENCPLLFEIINIFLLQKKDGRNVSEKHFMSATHALAILVSFKIMFTLLCISFGGGSRFVGMMNHLGFTVSWQKAMQVFEGQKKKMEENIKWITPAQIPLILLMDNINMYRGKRKHLRLYKSFGPTMWNFTVRAMMIPNTDGLEHILCDKEACLSSQSSAIEMEPDDIFLEKHPEKVDLFSAAVNRYLSELLHVALNTVALTTEELKEMNESQLNSHLSKIGNNTENPCEYKIEIAKEEVVKTSCNIRSNVHMLPLSLEDNSTIFGAMSILNYF